MFLKFYAPYGMTSEKATNSSKLFVDTLTNMLAREDWHFAP